MNVYPRLALLGYGLLILALTLAPVPEELSSIARAPGLDKVVHALMFGGLGFLGCWTIASPRPILTVGLALMLAWGTAALVELLQALVPYRDPDLVDFWFGAVGAVVGVAAFRLGAKLLGGRWRGGAF